MTAHTEKLMYRGVGYALEEDKLGLWWGLVLGKHQGPCRTRTEAEHRVQDWIDSRT
jgi:hypothetical protein